MKLKVILDIPDEEIKKLLAADDGLDDTDTDEDEDDEDEKPAKKKKKAAVDMDDDEDEDEESDDDEDEDEKPAKKKKKGEDPRDSIIEKLQAYSEEHSRKEAIAILKKFKVKDPHQLKEADLPKILKLLKDY